MSKNSGYKWSAIKVFQGTISNLSSNGKYEVATLYEPNLNKYGSNLILVVSNNAGSTWKEIQEHSFDQLDQQLYTHVTNGGKIWLMGSPLSGTRGIYSALWESKNGGKSFKVIKLPKHTLPTGGFSSLGQLVALTVYDTLNRRYSVIISRNYFKWVNVGLSTVTPLYSVDIKSENSIYAGGGNFARLATSPADEVWLLNPSKKPRILWNRIAPKKGNYQPIIKLDLNQDNGVILTGGSPSGSNTDSPGELYIKNKSFNSFRDTHVEGTNFDNVGSTIVVFGNANIIYISKYNGISWNRV